MRNDEPFGTLCAVTTHDEWVAAGYCPSVSSDGDRCSQMAGHSWPHETPRFEGGVVIAFVWLDGACVVNGGVEGRRSVAR